MFAYENQNYNKNSTSSSSIFNHCNNNTNIKEKKIEMGDLESIFDLVAENDSMALESFFKAHAARKSSEVSMTPADAANLQKDAMNQTALAAAIRALARGSGGGGSGGAGRAASATATLSTLLEFGAAKFVFVKGYLPDSLVCTLPMTEQPKSDFFDHPEPLSVEDLDPDVLRLIDDKLSEYIEKLRESASASTSASSKRGIAVSSATSGTTAATSTTTSTVSAIPAAFNNFPTPLVVGQIVRRGAQWQNQQEDEDQLPDGSSEQAAGVVIAVNVPQQTVQMGAFGGMMPNPTSAPYYQIDWRQDINDPNSSFSQSFVAYSASVLSLFVVDPQNQNNYPLGVPKPKSYKRNTEKFKVGDKVMLSSDFTSSELHRGKTEEKNPNQNEKAHQKCLGSLKAGEKRSSSGHVLQTPGGFSCQYCGMGGPSSQTGNQNCKNCTKCGKCCEKDKHCANAKTNDGARSANSVGVVVAVKKYTAPKPSANVGYSGGYGMGYNTTQTTIEDTFLTVMALHNGSMCDYFNADLQYADGSRQDCFENLDVLPIGLAAAPSPSNKTLKVGDKVKLKKHASDQRGCLGNVSMKYEGTISRLYPQGGQMYYYVTASNPWTQQGNCSTQHAYKAQDVELAKTATGSPLMTGDVVQLADNFTANGGDGWCLGQAKSGKLGVVLLAATKTGEATQSNVAVSSVDDPSKFYFFDSSWLKRASVETKVCNFKVGDRVQLRVENYRKGEEVFDKKCLSSLYDAVYGIVVSSGVCRDGISRNIEVVAVGGPRDKQISLYPGYALRLADRSSILTVDDRRNLKRAIDATVIEINGSLDFDTDTLINQHGNNVWNVLYDILSNDDAVTDNWQKWQAGRNLSTWEFSSEPRREQYTTDEKFSFSSSSASGGGAGPNVYEDFLPFACRVIPDSKEAIWKCSKDLNGGKCRGFNNPIEADKCKICKTDRPESWKCSLCKAKNIFNKKSCIVCFTVKDEADLMVADLKAKEKREIEEKKAKEKKELEEKEVQDQKFREELEVRLKAEAEAEEAEMSRKKTELTEEGGRFRHPGSFDKCGGNPDGIIGSHGDGVCDGNCERCGKGTHWSCCSSDVKEVLYCPESLPFEKAFKNASILLKNNHGDQRFIVCRNIPGYHTAHIAQPTTWTCEACTVVNDLANKRCDVCETPRPVVPESSPTAPFTAAVTTKTSTVKDTKTIVCKDYDPANPSKCKAGKLCKFYHPTAGDKAKGGKPNKCKLAACTWNHAAHRCKVCGDADADHWESDCPKASSSVSTSSTTALSPPLSRLYASISETYKVTVKPTKSKSKSTKSKYTVISHQGGFIVKQFTEEAEAMSYFDKLSASDPQSSRAFFMPNGTIRSNKSWFYKEQWRKSIEKHYQELSVDLDDGNDADSVSKASDDSDEDHDEKVSSPRVAVKKRTTFTEITKNKSLSEKYFMTGENMTSSAPTSSSSSFVPVALDDISPASFGNNFDMPDKLGRQNSQGFYKLKSFSPLDSLRALCTSCDKNKNAAAHHLARMKLFKSLDALIRASAGFFDNSNSVRWQPNKFHDTPMSLSSRFGLGFDAGERQNLLFRSLAVRSLLPQGPPIGLVLQTNPQFSHNVAFESLIEAILLKEEGNADYHRKTAMQGKVPGASLYSALFYFAFKMGLAEVKKQLDLYLTEMHVSHTPSSEFDPLYFYLKLKLFKNYKNKPSHKKGERLLAFDAYTTLQHFPVAFDKWIAIESEDKAYFAKFFGDLKLSATEELPEDDEDDYSDLIPPPSPTDPETIWIKTKVMYNLESKSTDALMNMVGLKNIKQTALTFMLKVLLSPPPDVNLNITCNLTFVGNPGCGKTTVGKLLGKAMAELKYRKNPDPVECTADDCLDPKAFGALVQKADGGTLFIDECDTFQPSPPGQPKNDSAKAIKALMRYSDVMKDSTTFVIAGYKDAMDILKAADDGFKSRFPDSLEFNFHDYTEVELTKILYDMTKARGLRFESKSKCGVPLCRVLARRIHRGAGLKGFGNGRNCEKVLERCIEKQLARLQQKKISGDIVRDEEYRVLTRADTVGERPKFEESPHMATLNEMVGLEKVKAQISELMNLQLNNYDAEMRGEKPDSVSLHRVFLGNPGTGKTTVVELYGKMLKEFGYLSNGDYIKRTPADILQGTGGSSGPAMAALMEAAKGKVLFIDEAYNLDPAKAQFGREVLDVLLEKLNAGGNVDMCVVLAGYDSHMEEMFRNANNPGLEGRFNLSKALYFEDYTDPQIRDVLKSMLTRKDYFADSDTLDYAVTLISKKRIGDGFANAREAESILGQATLNLNNRIAAAVKAGIPIDNKRFIQEDFEGEITSIEKARAVFAGMENVDFLQESVENWIQRCLAQDEDKGPGHRQELIMDNHMLFLGPPGTGKTSNARKMAEVFFQLDLLPSNKCKIIEPRDVTGAYVGHSGNNMKKAMEEARGGILFIDEAYDMHPAENLFGDEIMTTLFTLITNETYKGKMVVILAGYEDKVQKLFDFNPGFESRFNKERIYFPHWTGKMATKFVVGEIQKDGKAIDEDAIDAMESYFNIASQHVNWGSARDAKENILKGMVASRQTRQMKHNQTMRATSAAAGGWSAAAKATRPPPVPYTLEDVKPVFERFLANRQAKIGARSIQSVEEYEAEISAAGDNLVICDFYADWCLPCQISSPSFDELASKHKKVVFIKVDTENDALRDITMEHFQQNISLPSILFLKKGKRVGLTVGFDKSAIEKKISELTAPPPRMSEEKEGAGGGGGSKMAAPAPPKTDVKIEVKKAPVNPTPPGGGKGGRGGLNWDAIWEEFERILAEQNPPLDQAALEAMFNNAAGFPPPHILEEIFRRLKISIDEEDDVVQFLKEKRVEVAVRINEAKDGEKCQEKDKDTEEEKKLKKLIPQLMQCPMGFNWRKEGAGYRCLGGSHYVSLEQLRRHFMKMTPAADGK